MANKLKALRVERGLTIDDLTNMSIHFRRSSISGWERGSSVPSAVVIVEYAKVFNVSTDWLLGSRDEV